MLYVWYIMAHTMICKRPGVNNVWYIMAHTMICKRYGVKTLAWIHIECESMIIDHVSSISTLFKL